MSKLIKETKYGKSEDFQVLIVCPHGSRGEKFFEMFPQIKKHPKITKNLELFNLYVDVERDVGTVELSHAIAEKLENFNISSLVLELEYPRAILDGGRTLDFCIRNALPDDLNEELNGDFKKIHESSLKRLFEICKSLKSREGRLIDVHTMGSFCPMKDGKKQTFSVSFSNLEAYTKQFSDAPKTTKNLREFDLICSDSDGVELGDECLRLNLEKELHKAEVPYQLNKPYAASREFLMYPNLKNCRGVCFDIPKHSLSPYHNDPYSFNLETMEVSDAQIEAYSNILARSLKHCLEESN